ncbi:putative adhesin [Streptomyces sp. NPDC001262]|uniref:putative adhesin n=1 Tax=Streptomyces sp. NPDC001262 TaxID=3364552 RepID=UPI0036A90039
MIEPGKIPHCTSNFDQLEKDAAALKKTASSIRTTGGDIHSTFQGLDPVYEAPEKDALLHTTVPVREGADHFASKLATVGSALSDFAHTGRPLAKRMDELRHEAEAFAKSVADDKHWQRDAKKQKENARLTHEVGRVWGEFQDAERSAADKISALVGNTRWVPDDGSHKPGMYGFATEDAAKADKTPWGTVDKREYTGVKWLWHHGTHFVGGMVEGFFKDGIWNTLTGLGHMVNVFDWKKFKETWHGIGLVGKGIAMYGVEPLERAMNPMGGEFAPRPDHERAKKAAREFGKSLLAWDQWKKNPGRAIGTVAFNGITLGMGPLLKLGKAGELGNMGKAGEAGSNVAKVAGALGRAGQLVDPMTYIGGAAKYAKIQVGELLTSLKETRTGPTGDFLNGASKHPGALTGLPKGFEYTNHEGRLRVITEDGNILDEHGRPAESPAVKEPHKDGLPSVHETSPSEPRVLAGVGASHPQVSAHMEGGTAENAGSHTSGHNTDSHGSEPGPHGHGEASQTEGAPSHHDDHGGGPGADSEHSAGGDDVVPHAHESATHAHTPFDEGHRGTGDPLPAPQDVKQALMDRKLQMIDKSRYTPDDGHYYATRVFEGGRLDGETVFAGHGYLRRGSGEMVVPPGTTISFYVPHGDLLPGLNGITVEAGVYPGGYVETFRPGDVIPDYTLDAPAAGMGGGFSVMEKSTTVSQRALLSQILKPEMGNVHWAACREIEF